MKATKQDKERYNKWYRDTYHANPIRFKAKATLTHHRKKGHKTIITVDEVETLFNTTKYCSICGCELIVVSSVVCNNLSTLDRIDNESVLTTDNCWVICNNCNRMKGDKPFKEFISFCHSLYEKHKGAL